MRDIMQSALQPPDLIVWEKTLLPTTSSRIKRLPNGSLVKSYSVWSPSEDGAMESLEKSLNELNRIQTDALSLQWEERLSSLQDTQTSSSETLCPYSTWVLMEQPQKLEHMLEETDDESTSDEWRQTPSTSDISLERMVCGSLLQIISSAASTIHRIGRSILDSRK